MVQSRSALRTRQALTRSCEVCKCFVCFANMDSSLFVRVSTLIATFVCVQGQTSCAAGTKCVSLYDCQEMLTVVNNPNRTPQDVDNLRKAQCGFQNSIPWVCCPDTCFTLDEQKGTCISIYSCPHIANMLKPPIPTDILAFVQGSRCESSDPYSVCCGATVKPAPKPYSVCTPSAAPPDPRTECCGLESEAGNRIYGGTATAVDQYPWLTIIEYFKDNKIKLLCGGALISGKYVLSAGHCVIGPVLKAGIPKNVRLGEYDTANEGLDCVAVEGGGQDCTEGVTIIAIERTIPHPKYDPDASLRRDDIALIRLKELAPYTDFIRPICLPTNDITTNTLAIKLFAAGWGAVNETTSSTNIKQHVQLPYKTLESCQPMYSVSRRNVALWHKQLCAGGEKDKDSCKGDSGGPLMYQKGKIFEVMGIVSFGPTPCGIENTPGVYTKVFEYVPWIRTQIKP